MTTVTNVACVLEVVAVTLECFMCGVLWFYWMFYACIMKQILPLYNFKYSFSRIQCCNLKMGGFGLCNVGQKIGKNKPETHYCCFVEGLEEKKKKPV